MDKTRHGVQNVLRTDYGIDTTAPSQRAELLGDATNARERLPNGIISRAVLWLDRGGSQDKVTNQKCVHSSVEQARASIRPLRTLRYLAQRRRKATQSSRR